MNIFICTRCADRLDDDTALFFYDSDNPYCEECFKYLEDKTDNEYEAMKAIQDNIDEAEATGN